MANGIDIIARGLAGSGLTAANLANARIDALPKGVVYKGVVNYYSDLPNNAELGDMYTIKYQGDSGAVPSGAEYVWTTYENVDQWIQITDSIDSELSPTSEHPVQNKAIYAGIQTRVEGLDVAPVSDNDSGVIKIVYLKEEPAQKYNGYLYIIDNPQHFEGEMLVLSKDPEDDYFDGTTLVLVHGGEFDGEIVEFI